MNYINALKFEGCESCFNKSTLVLNRTSNLILTPARYMLGGRSGTCYAINNNLVINRFVNICEIKANLINTAIAVTLFIPSLIIGSVLKGTAIYFSVELRNKYRDFNLVKSSSDKINDELSVGFITMNKKHFTTAHTYYSQLSVNDKQNKFIRKNHLHKVESGVASDSDVDNILEFFNDTIDVDSLIQKISAS